MQDFLTPRQKLLLEYAKEKKEIRIIDVQKFYTTNPIGQLQRLIALGYFAEDTNVFGSFKFTGKKF